MPNFKKNNIKFFYQNNDKRIISKIYKNFKEDNWVNGNIIKSFENDFKQKLKTNSHACSCNSGTDALKLAILLDRDKSKDIYLTTPYSYIATSSVVKFLNLNIIYIDVEKDNFLLDLNKLEYFLENSPINIKKRIKGIIFVELFGNTTDLPRLKKIAKKNRLTLIGDCAQSFGTKFKNHSTCNYYDYSAYSFYPTKMLSAYGDSGMLMIKDEKKLKKALLLKNNGHGEENKDHCQILGINSRMDSIQAFILKEQLKTVNKVKKKKKIIFDYYNKEFKNLLSKPIFNKDNKSNNYIYTFYLPQKCKIKFLNYMKKNNIECKAYYNSLLAENNLLKSETQNPLTNALYNKKNLICLPSNEKLKITEIYKVSKLVKQFIFNHPY